MDKDIYYKVWIINKMREKQLVATYSDPLDAHEAAQRYNIPSNIIQIEKTAIPKT